MCLRVIDFFMEFGDHDHYRPICGSFLASGDIFYLTVNVYAYIIIMHECLIFLWMVMEVVLNS